VRRGRPGQRGGQNRPGGGGAGTRPGAPRTRGGSSSRPRVQEAPPLEQKEQPPTPTDSPVVDAVVETPPATPAVETPAPEAPAPEAAAPEAAPAAEKPKPKRAPRKKADS